MLTKGQQDVIGRFAASALDDAEKAAKAESGAGVFAYHLVGVAVEECDMDDAVRAVDAAIADTCTRRTTDTIDGRRMTWEMGGRLVFTVSVKKVWSAEVAA
jgi:hypothetical protein